MHGPRATGGAPDTPPWRHSADSRLKVFIPPARRISPANCTAFTLTSSPANATGTRGTSPLPSGFDLRSARRFRRTGQPAPSDVHRGAPFPRRDCQAHAAISRSVDGTVSPWARPRRASWRACSHTASVVGRRIASTSHHLVLGGTTQPMPKSDGHQAAPGGLASEGCRRWRQIPRIDTTGSRRKPPVIRGLTQSDSRWQVELVDPHSTYVPLSQYNITAIPAQCFSNSSPRATAWLWVNIGWILE